MSRYAKNLRGDHGSSLATHMSAVHYAKAFCFDVAIASYLAVDLV